MTPDTSAVIAELRARIDQPDEALRYLWSEVKGPLDPVVVEYLGAHLGATAYGLWTSSGWRPSLVLRDYSADVVMGWTQRFGPYRRVSFGSGDLMRAEPDAVVTTINTHGELQGGAGGACRRVLGRTFERRIRMRVEERFSGRIPIGQAMHLATSHRRLRHLIVVVVSEPSGVQEGFGFVQGHSARGGRVTDPEVIYRATRHALERALEVDPPIRRLGMVGMGAGGNGIDPFACAEAMFRACEVTGYLEPRVG